MTGLVIRGPIGSGIGAATGLPGTRCGVGGVGAGTLAVMAGAVGRLMRWQPPGWEPVGDPLPPFAHAPPAPQLLLAPWVLPRDLEPRAYDVLVVGELAHQLVTKCERDDPLYIELAEQTMLFNDREQTLAWLAEIEVWVGRRLDPGRDWPLPPAAR